jgi:molybdopterin/thiamine biosynthesis adenylyltransferase
MNRRLLAIAESDFEQLRTAATLDVETAFVAQLGVADDGERATYTLHSVVPVVDHTYRVRSADRMTIRSEGFMPAIGEAARAGQSFAFIHTHPGASSTPSTWDDVVDAQLAQVTFRRTGSHHYASLIVGSGGDEVTARVLHADGRIDPIDAVRVAGRGLRYFDRPTDDHEEQLSEDTFDRQIRVFGAAGQRRLAGLHIGIAGAGGTGSAVCEQLIRLGVGAITIVDDDIVSLSNVTRIYGSSTQDIGQTKVAVADCNATRIGLGTTFHPIVDRIDNEAAARALRHCDVIFGCTDDHRGRSILNRLSYWYLIPIIDTAVVVRPDAERHVEITGRVTIVGPDNPCLLCRGRIDPAMLNAETLPADERARLAVEGYVVGLAEPDPSVVTYTSTIAAIATSELLARLFDLAERPHPSELLVRLSHRDIRRNDVAPHTGHFCAENRKWGRADDTPFLGLVWT